MTTKSNAAISNDAFVMRPTGWILAKEESRTSKR